MTFLTKFSTVSAAAILIAAQPVLAASEGMISDGKASESAYYEASDSVALSATPITRKSGTVVYEAPFFIQYRPVTVLDMIRYVPGGISILNSLNNSQGGRGIGSTGAQILVGGRRVSGKSNNISSRLTRIQSGQVKRIELIRDSAEGLDIRSEGVIINIILDQAEADKSATIVEGTLQYNSVQDFTPELLISHSGTKGRFDYTVSYNRDPFKRAQKDIEERFYLGNSPDEYRDQRRNSSRPKNRLSTNLRYDLGSSHIVQLNALYEDEVFQSPRVEDQYTLDQSTLLGQEVFLFRSPEDKWEIAADYEGDVGFLGSMKAALVVNSGSDSATTQQDFIADGVMSEIFSLTEEAKSEEQIARVSLAKTIWDKHTFEYGAEAAFTGKYVSQQFFDDPADASSVDEDRYEVFVTHSLSLGKTSLQSAINREFSTINQRTLGDVNSRSFQYWKPRLEVRHDIDDQNQLRFVGEYLVSQLNLGNFFARRNTDDNTIDFGNPNLEPEKTWRLSAAYEKRLANNAGSFEVEIIRDTISDHISKLEIEPGIIGIGNIGSASRLGVNISSTLNLSVINIPSVSITTDYRYRDTETTDAFLQEKRPLNSQPKHFINLDFQQDFPSIGVTWGASIHKRSKMYRTDFSFQEVRSNALHFSNIYGEYKFRSGTKIRLEVRQAFSDKKHFDRTIYDGNLADGAITRLETRASSVKPTFALKVQTTF